jgi:hypothetical protein
VIPILLSSAFGPRIKNDSTRANGVEHVSKLSQIAAAWVITDHR